MKFKIKKADNPRQVWTKNIKANSDAKSKLEKLSRYKAARGLKFSKKRATIIEYFINADRHFTIEQLYNELKKTQPKIGYSTVYRALKLLVDCGLAKVHHFGENNARFELVHKESHHDHLVCEECGRIIEFTHQGIEKFQKDVAQKYNFSVNYHELQIFGMCDKCRLKKDKK